MGVEARAGDACTCGPSGDGEGAEECSASRDEGSTESQAAWGAGRPRVESRSVGQAEQGSATQIDGPRVRAVGGRRGGAGRGVGWRFLLFSWLSFSTVSPVGDSRDRLRESPDDGEGSVSYDTGGSLCDGAEISRASGQLASAVRVEAHEQGEREWRERPRSRRSRRGAPSRRRRTSDRRYCLRSEAAEQAARDARHASETSSIADECYACSEDVSDEASVCEAGFATSIEAGWRGAHARALGSLEAHVTFLQWVFRATTGVARGCWSRGGLRGPLRVALAFGRRASRSRCENGANLASDDEFATQRALSEEMLDWYSTYVALLRRLDSGKTPFVIQNFCGGGGSSEGCRRAGGASHGVDLYHQGGLLSTIRTGELHAGRRHELVDDTCVEVEA